MDANAPICRIVRLRIPIGNFLFVNARQSVRIIIVRVCVKFSQKRRDVVVKLFISGFPAKRHYYMLIDKRRICNNSGFFVIALV